MSMKTIDLYDLLTANELSERVKKVDDLCDLINKIINKGCNINTP